MATAKVRLYASCPQCSEHDFRIDHLAVGASVSWTCENCGEDIHIIRSNQQDYLAASIGKKQTPITVTLRSSTTPPIEVKINTWHYHYKENESPEEFLNSQKFLYEEHTCPTNWFRDVVEIIFEGDQDPHGLFKLVSVEDGHYKSNSEIEI